MHALDIVDVHIWAPSPTAAYQEQVTDETTGQTSSVLVLNSPSDGPLTPEFDTHQIGNALDWGGVWDTPMAFVYEIGHSTSSATTRASSASRARPSAARSTAPTGPASSRSGSST